MLIYIGAKKFLSVRPLRGVIKCLCRLGAILKRSLRAYG